jgi:hypothetical protein
MANVPFKKTTTPAPYSGASSPSSKGRMPTNMTTAPKKVDSGPDARRTFPAPPVDGAVRGHDTNYPRKPKQKT